MKRGYIPRGANAGDIPPVGSFSDKYLVSAELSPDNWTLSLQNGTSPSDPVGSALTVDLSALMSSSSLPNLTTLSFTYGAKPAAINRSVGITMAEDLTDMVGYAAVAGVTGGTGGPEYWVINDTVDDALVEGTFRWAVEQARAGGVPAKVLFDPRASFDVVLNDQLEPPANITIDAPARNARIWANTDVTRIKVIETNNIIRRMSFGSLVTGATTERDALWIDPSLNDSFWIDSCTFSFCGDGCLEIVSVADPLVDCLGTVTNCLFRYHDKVSLIGSLACYQDSLTTAIPAYCSVGGEPPVTKIFVTTYRNLYEYTSERNPKVLPGAFVHSVNNVRHLAPMLRDDGSTAAVYGIYAGTGGMALSEGDLFTSAATTGWSGIETASGVFSPRVGSVLAVDGPGFTKQVGSVAADSIVLSTAGSASVLTPPYVLAPTTIVDTAEGRADFLNSVRSTVGAQVDSAPEGVFVYDPTSLEPADGVRTLSLTATGAGRYLRIDSPERRAVPNDPDVTMYAVRGSTLTIASGVINLPAEGTYFAVATEGGVAVDTLSTINGALNGRIIILRPASTSGDVIIDSSGNVNVATGTLNMLYNGDSTTLIYDSGIAKFTPIASTIPGYNTVGNEHLTKMAPNLIKGRSTIGTGNVEDLTGTQVTALLNVVTTTEKGLAPASGGGTANFLRADGTWAAPAGGGGGGVTDGDKGDIIVSSGGLVWTMDYTAVNAVIAPTWANVSGKPTSLAGYGITDALSSDGVLDSVFQLSDNLDPTKLGKFQLAGLTTGVTRIWTMPDASTGIPGLTIQNTFNSAQTFTSTGFTAGSNTGNVFANIGHIATLLGSIKTLNLGTLGASGAQTNINIGSGHSSGSIIDVVIGSAGVGTLGSLTVNSPTVTFGPNNTALLASDGALAVRNTADPTKQLKLDVSAIPTATVVTLAVPGSSGTLALDTAFGAGAKGLAPASGGGTVNFLRADGSWAAPAGGISAVVYPQVKAVAGVIAKLQNAEGSPGTTAAAANQTRMYLYVPPYSQAYTAFGINVTTAVAASLAKVAIYVTDPATGHPTTPLGETADLDCSTTGFKSAALALTLNANTVYALLVRPSSNQSMSTIGNAVPLMGRTSFSGGGEAYIQRFITHANPAPDPWVYAASEVQQFSFPFLVAGVV